MVRAIGAGLRAAPDEAGRSGARWPAAVVAMWCRSPRQRHAEEPDLVADHVAAGGAGHAVDGDADGTFRMSDFLTFAGVDPQSRGQ
jgi:hypothetical protein